MSDSRQGDRDSGPQDDDRSRSAENENPEASGESTGDESTGGGGADTGDPTAMTVLEHIAELRTTLIWALVMALAAAVVAWFFSDQIIDALLRPARLAGQERLIFTKPMEAFILKLKASLVVGLFVVFPLILQRLYSFVMPGLMPNEKKMVTPLLVVSTGLFYVGVLFCYLVLLPLVIKFAVGFATDYLQPMLTAEAYFDLAARLCFAFGILFELPMVVFILSWVGVVDPRSLLRGWRYALVLILAASAVLTPPDVISQVLLGGPVMLLYIVSVLISMWVRKRRDAARERQRAEDEALERAERELDMEERRRRAQERRDDEDEGDDTDDDPEDPDDDPNGGGSTPPGPPEPEGSTGSTPPAPEPRPAEGARPRTGGGLEEAPDPAPGEDVPTPPWVVDDDDRPVRGPSPAGSGGSGPEQDPSADDAAQDPEKPSQGPGSGPDEREGGEDPERT